jgi:hypothetical protein
MSRNLLVRSTAAVLLALFLTAPLAWAMPRQAPRAEAAASWSGTAGLLRLLWSLVAPKPKEGGSLDPSGNTSSSGPRGEEGSSLDPNGAASEGGGSLDPSGAMIEGGGSLDPDGAR